MTEATTIDVPVDRPAHGGESIGLSDGRVILVRGAIPGERVRVALDDPDAKLWRGEAVEILEPSPHRVERTCAAALAGAGCCDADFVDPAHAPELKREVLLDALRRIGRFTPDELPDVSATALAPARGWRTRVRLGVDEQGRAGFRARGSNDIVPVACTQVVDGLLDGLIGDRRFTPGAEVVAVLDSEGQRHVVETRRAPRGRRVERVTDVLEGTGTVTEHADGHTFRFPATAFWQAHTNAPDAYTGVIRRWLADLPDSEADEQIGWDLYGGVGLFIPAIADSLGGTPVIHSVDYSPAAAELAQEDLAPYRVERHNRRVEAAVATLPTPRVVVLDPPRTGAGDEVVTAVAAKAPETVIHIGCDPATFARDARTWGAAGYQLIRLAVVNAFPGTHHFEIVAELNPGKQSG